VILPEFHAPIGIAPLFCDLKVNESIGISEGMGFTSLESLHMKKNKSGRLRSDYDSWLIPGIVVYIPGKKWDK